MYGAETTLSCEEH